MNRYPAKQIIEDLMVETAYDGDTILGLIVARALSKAPKRVVDTVVKECDFAVLGQYGRGTRMCLSPNAKHQIVFSGSILSKTASHQYREVLSAVAEYMTSKKGLAVCGKTRKYSKKCDSCVDRFMCLTLGEGEDGDVLADVSTYQDYEQKKSYEVKALVTKWNRKRVRDKGKSL